MSNIWIFFNFILALTVLPLINGNAYLLRASIPLDTQGQINSSRHLQISQIHNQPRHFNLPSLVLPSMGKVSETLGAINSIVRFLKRKTNAGEIEVITTATGSPTRESAEIEDNYPGSVSASQKKFEKISVSPLTVDPVEDEQLGNALYKLSRTVLGKNVTDTFVPVMQTMNTIGKLLPPFIYRDGRIILGNSNNATTDGGAIKDVVCTTPAGNPGKCLDLSGCPSLLFDLTNLRKSLCFKALFIPGVCCPDRSEKPPKKPPQIDVITTGRPLIIESTRPPPPPFPEIPNTGIPPAEFPQPLGITSRGCGKPEALSFRIVDGDKSSPGMWPWMAAIFLHGPKGQEFWCGGTLISERYILTAAHCTRDQKQKSFSPRQFTVRLGEYDLVQEEDYTKPETFRVTEIIAHKEFSGVGFYNDLALLKLERDVKFSGFISPICLPTGRTISHNFVGTAPTVIGWGTGKYGGRENTALQQVNLPVWSNSDCDRAYFQPITDIFLCAGYPQGGKDACQGDSGGPLMLELDGRWVQIGIVSFGNRCAEPGYPGVYTRVTQFLDWILANAI